MARPLGSRNKKTLLLEAEAKAMVAGTADGPRAVPTLSRVMRYYLDKADLELAKPDGGDPAVVERCLGEARATAAILAPFQSPRLSAVAVGAVTKMVVVVKGGLPPRDTRALPAIAPPAVEGRLLK